LAADWAAAAVVPPDWAARSGGGLRPFAADEVAESELTGPAFAAPTLAGGAVPAAAGEPTVAYASWRAPTPLRLPEVTPLRARPLIGSDGTRYAVAPFGRAGLVLVIARSDEDDMQAAAFHVTEVDRVAQLVRAAAVILGDRLDRLAAPPVAHPS
ncbi:MAG TPA: hypothetical protein VFO77_16715, partial [Actinoplanes sp.]|nr:hypothetical protein [Actinoplanes sp.]